VGWNNVLPLLGFSLRRGKPRLIFRAIRSTLAARNTRGRKPIAHWETVMNESTHIEDFSALDDWAPVIPEWQAFRPEAHDPCSIKEDCAD
jgi:hypothetical protein